MIWVLRHISTKTQYRAEKAIKGNVQYAYSHKCVNNNSNEGSRAYCKILRSTAKQSLII